MLCRLVLILFIVFSSSLSFSQSRCVEIFKSASQTRASLTLEAYLQTLTYTDRLNTIEQEIVQLKSNSAPSPGFLRRLFSAQARDHYAAQQSNSAQIQKLQKMLSKYREIENLIVEARKTPGFRPEDEVQLLNRIFTDKEYVRSLKTIQRGQTDTKNSSTEQDYFTSMFYYMIWGPDLSIFAVPFHHWVLLNATMGRENPTHLTSLVEQTQQSVDTYRAGSETAGNDSKGPHETPSFLSAEDPIARMIADTDSAELNRALEEAMEDGILSPEERVELTSEIEASQDTNSTDPDSGSHDSDTSDSSSSDSSNDSSSYDTSTDSSSSSSDF